TLRRIAGYASYFQRAFGDRAITAGRVASALADYQRTRMSGNSAWDRWQGGDAGALSPSARRGWELFTGEARCSRCHYGPNPCDLSPGDIDELVDFLGALDGEGFMDHAPTAFPQ